MANFRPERLFVILDEPVPGLDHLKAVDVVEFAYHGSDDDAGLAGLKPLESFTFTPGERPRWYAAAAGLKTVRGLLDLYRDRTKSPLATPEQQAALASRMAVLLQVEAVLTAADRRDRRFHLSARDVPGARS